ncbi:ABC transporter related protein [Xylanimonas cellulosilytica DSM 15894]|uniref:Fatty acid ABC transporter ATP-binding/permease protein n=1 Tax=Xylanimonas cellulosilytica (strain DSM 15894 / JCM 12276 / CECT 5975 / KCTC 9989 / LMG 20990 / NBRC 107835 / XIL07) TaxID=446471 RepID=D1BRX1_XYLCX|nr:ABC transporter ATP-binding protein [Xylanimonas cellulosilytica]ACZ30463.1 ABC transporter related protein [Xylanimonas cellulosilytica DSM 15894]
MSAQDTAGRPPRRTGPGPGPGGPMGMGMPGDKAIHFQQSLLRFARSMRPERGRVVALMLCGVASVALAVTGPRILGHGTNIIFEGVVGKLLATQFPPGTTAEQAVTALRAAGEGRLADMLAGMGTVVAGQGIDFDRLGRVLLGVLAIYGGAFLFGWLQARIMTVAVQNTMRRLRDEVEAKLHRVPLGYVDKQQKGEILSRVTNDIDNVAQTTTQTLAQLVTSVLTVVGVLAMMFSISWILALVALVTVPLSVWMTARIAKRSQPQFVAQWAATGRLNAHVEEMFTGHSLVKVYGQQEAAAQKFAVENEALFAASQKAQAISGTIMPSMGFLANLNYVVVAVVGGLRVASGQLSLGDVQAFIQYSRQFTQPLTQVASMMNLLQSGVASAERVYALLDAPEQTPDPASPTGVEQVRGRVAFEDVSFSYDPAAPLIEHLDLVAEPGQTVAIVGPTGAGKTTLVNLLMRFYEVDSGRITLDGVDTRTMTRDALRSSIGMVLQDTWLFKGTIEENLRYGVRRDISREDFLAATRATHVDPFVRHLPQGYDTVLDDDGTALSVGEKQLLTIARAFLADPEILVLDEATSSVDTRTEVLVQHAMNALRSGRTSFVIAHRLSTIRDADAIVVMEHGQIVETGDHASLLAADGAYARLYRSQFAAPVATE